MSLFLFWLAVVTLLLVLATTIEFAAGNGAPSRLRSLPPFTGDNAHCHGAKRWHCVGIPVTALLFQYIVWRVTLKTLWNNGIDWRGTHYSLQGLRANKL